MFKNNKYTQWYYNIIGSAKVRINVGYTENHHIEPKCLGGSESKDNIVSLTAKEHFICHLLLTKMNDSYKLKFALNMMITINPNQIGKRFIVKNSRTFEYIKKCNSEAAKIRMEGFTGHNTGKKIYHDEYDNEFYISEGEDTTGLTKGMSQTRKDNVGKGNKNKRYCYHPYSYEVQAVSDNKKPDGWVWGNPNAARPLIFKGKKYYHNKNTGEELRSSSKPNGDEWIKGRCVKWITNGKENKQLNYINDEIPDGWKLGRTNWRK